MPVASGAVAAAEWAGAPDAVGASARAAAAVDAAVAAVAVVAEFVPTAFAAPGCAELALKVAY